MNTKHKGDLPFFVKHITLRRFLRRQFSKYSLKNQDRMADSVFRRLHLSQKCPLPRGFFYFCYCFLPRLYYVQNYSTTVQALCQGGFLKNLLIMDERKREVRRLPLKLKHILGQGNNDIRYVCRTKIYRASAYKKGRL